MHMLNNLARDNILDAMRKCFLFKEPLGDTFWGSLIVAVLRRRIICTRCVRYTYQIGGSESIGTSNRAGYSEIGTFKKSDIKTETSGDVIKLYPVAWHSFNLTFKCYCFPSNNIML